MLTISKPLSAGQVRYRPTTRRNSPRKGRTITRNKASSPGNGKGDWRGSSALAGLCLPKTSQDSARASIRRPASNSCGNERRMNIRMPTARSSRQWSTEPAGMRPLSAPKSVSLTALVGGDERVREAHRKSVRVALDQLEHYTQARIGGDHLPETTGRFIAAKFEHDTPRPVDGYVAPQLHTHAGCFQPH
jgi:hypothetical protein